MHGVVVVEKGSMCGVKIGPRILSIHKAWSYTGPRILSERAALHKVIGPSILSERV